MVCKKHRSIWGTNLRGSCAWLCARSMHVARRLLFVRLRARAWAFQAHPSRGMYLGHAAFGVKSLNVFSAASGVTVEDCGSSASSSDAGNKWFFASVGEHDACASRSLRAELPSLEAAKASLAATVGELDAALPNMALCAPSLAMGTFERLSAGPPPRPLAAPPGGKVG